MFAEPELRRTWFRIPSAPDSAHHELDFRVGGHEVARGTFAGGEGSEELEYHSQFLEVAPGELIVLAYRFLVDGRVRWASLVTIEFSPEGPMTRLRHAEQYAVLPHPGDGRADVNHLEGGLRLQLNSSLPAALSRIDQKAG